MVEGKKPLKIFTSRITIEWPEGQYIVLRRPTPKEKATLQGEIYNISAVARRSGEAAAEVKFREGAFEARARMFDFLFIEANGIAMESASGEIVELTSATLANFDPVIKASVISEYIEDDQALAGATKK